MTGTPPPAVREASADAIHRGLAEIPDGATRVGVVRHPPRTVRAVVDETRPELGPPETLSEEFTAEREALMMRGLCEEGAHNAAWENVSFGDRYAAYLADGDGAGAALSALRRRLDAGEKLVLVGEYGGKLRSHRSILRERL